MRVELPATSNVESKASHAASEASVIETGRVEVQDSDDADRSSVVSQKTTRLGGPKSWTVMTQTVAVWSATRPRDWEGRSPGQ